jgi:hypothetical protein
MRGPPIPDFAAATSGLGRAGVSHRGVAPADSVVDHPRKGPVLPHSHPI